ncbi:TolC family protein, partial [Acinetobacter baumannii]
PAGLDSGILLRRPDVVQAEYTLRAANAQIGAARAALFPRISLTALAGLASTSLSSLFTGGAFNYSVAPSASYPIFRAGAGRAGVAQSQ